MQPKKFNSLVHCNSTQHCMSHGLLHLHACSYLSISEDCTTSRSSDARFMHKLCLFFTCQCHDQCDEGEQPSPQPKVERFHWIIPSKLDTFPLKQKSDKIEHSLFPPMYIPLWIAILFAERINFCKPRIISLFSCMWLQKVSFADVAWNTCS